MISIFKYKNLQNTIMKFACNIKLLKSQSFADQNLNCPQKSTFQVKCSCPKQKQISKPSKVEKNSSKMRSILKKKDNRGQKKVFPLQLRNSNSSSLLPYQIWKVNQNTRSGNNEPLSMKQIQQLPINESIQSVLNELNESEIGFEFEYQKEIYSHLLSVEYNYIPKKSVQVHVIDQNMRISLLNKIFQINSKFKFKSQTGFLAANIFERVLGLTKLNQIELPILFITVIHIAAKNEQVLFPRLRDLVQILLPHNKITPELVTQMESRVCILLNFDFTYPSPSTFIQHICAIVNLPKSLKERALNLAQHLLIDSEYRYWPSSGLSYRALQLVFDEALISSKSQRKSQNFEPSFLHQIWNQILNHFQ